MGALGVLVIVGVAVAVAAVLRAASWRSAEQSVRNRLGPLSVGGMVPGAEAIRLEGADPLAVLALHGFGDTPQSLAYVASACHRRGWTVHVPLLPGHGRSLASFAASTGEDWERGAREALRLLLERHQHVAIVGQSMGAALASLIAADEPRIASCTWLAPLLSTSPRMERGSRIWWLVALVQPVLPSDDSRSIHNPVESARARSPGVLPVQLVPRLVRLVHRAIEALPRVTAPTLVMQSREDNRLTGAGTEAAVARLGSDVRELRWVTGAGHVLSVDYGREALCEQIADWVGAHPVAPAVPAM